MVTEPLILGEHRDSVLTLWLNRPSKLNSLTDELLDALCERLTEAGADSTVGAIVITGSGRGFCAGQDLAVAADADGGIDVSRHLRHHYLPVVRCLRDLRTPVIAAINGVAAGAGLSLALACDLRVAAESATLVNAFVRIGLVPDAGGSYFLPRLIGLARALEMAMLGETVDSEQALQLGLVSRVVSDTELLPTVHTLAMRLARGPLSLGLIKQLFNQSLENSFEQQLSAEERAQVQAAASADFVEGVTAFLTKRPAHFTGR